MAVRNMTPMEFENLKFWGASWCTPEILEANRQKEAEAHFKMFVVKPVKVHDWHDREANKRGFTSGVMTQEIIPTVWGDCPHCGGQLPVTPDDRLVEHWPVGGKKPAEGGSRCPGSETAAQ